MNRPAEEVRTEWLDRLIECARDWRYSDEFLGTMVRNRLAQEAAQIDGSDV